MKVLVMQAYGERQGHFGVYTSKICQELGRLGHEVTVVTSQLDPSAFLSTPPLFEVVELGICNAWLEQPGSSVGRLFAQLRRMYAVVRNNVRVLSGLIQIWKERPVDVVHLFDYEPVSTLLLLWLSKQLFTIKVSPLVLVIHAANFSLSQHRGDILKGVYKVLARGLVRRLILHYTQAVVVHGTWHKDQLQKQLGLDGLGVSVEVVPYGTEASEMKVSQQAARQRLGIDYTGTVFLFFGMLRRDKGLTYLIEAIAGLSEDCRLLIAGSPYDWTSDEVTQMLESYGCKNRVLAEMRYVPEEEIPYYFYAADAVVLPYASNYVGGSGPLALACAYGRPVVASRVAEVANLVQSNEIGLLVAPADVDSLRHGLRELLSLGQLERSRLGENARRLAPTHSWANMARKFSQIYEQVLDGC